MITMLCAHKKYTVHVYTHIHTHTHSRLKALFPGLPGWAGTRKVKPIWLLVKQETVSGNGISWAICKSAPCSRQITVPAPHHSVFYRLDALPAAQPTASKHWRHCTRIYVCYKKTTINYQHIRATALDLCNNMYKILSKQKRKQSYLFTT